MIKFKIGMNSKQLFKEVKKRNKVAEKIVKSTVNDMRRRAVGKVADDVRKVYNIKKAEIMPAKKGDTDKKAGKISITGETLETMALKYTGRLLTPIHFGISPKAPIKGTAKQRKGKYIKAQIKKGQKKVLSKRAFMVKVKKKDPTAPATYIPFKQTGKGKKDIEPIKTVSVPQMIDNKLVRNQIKKDLNELVKARLNNNIRRFNK